MTTIIRFHTDDTLLLESKASSVSTKFLRSIRSFVFRERDPLLL